jgi:hypothetical protein
LLRRLAFGLQRERLRPAIFGEQRPRAGFAVLRQGADPFRRWLRRCRQTLQHRRVVGQGGDVAAHAEQGQQPDH